MLHALPCATSPNSLIILCLLYVKMNVYFPASGYILQISSVNLEFRDRKQ